MHSFFLNNKHIFYEKIKMMGPKLHGINLMSRLFIAMVTCFLVYSVHAQGCSDAGVCTLHAFRFPGINPGEKKNTFNAGLSAGAADHSIFVLTSHIGFE